ncbi:MAG: tRNA dihydrouridine synthase DusB [Clostridia bacterium]|nr:tRNA dihydrouridine synthase DusB [Clostridia bacterium]
MTIGNLTLSNNMILAPLAGVTDLAFRILCKEQGAGLVVSEMISAKGVHYGGNGSIELARTDLREAPLCVQIFGSEPDLLAEAAKRFQDEGAPMIDINMGCPMRKITGNGEGSALLQQPKLIEKIVRTVKSNVDIPVTVKMRKGFVSGTETAVECALAAEAGGADWVTVHGRFRDEYYTGVSDLNCIRRVKEALRIPVIGNGDIVDTKTALRMFQETDCDGIMIGRGALGNPWIFRELSGFANAPTLAEKKAMILRHLDLVMTFKGETLGVPEMRKHVAWYLKGLRGAAKVRDAVCRSGKQQEIISILEEYFKEIEVSQ